MTRVDHGRWHQASLSGAMSTSAGDRWRRTGRATARPAVAGEVINSLEGRQTASEGDWVIRGSRGEEWITTAEHFTANYQTSESSSLSNP